MELIQAVEDLAGLFERNAVGNIIRGALVSPALAMDTHFASAVSYQSTLFKLPVDAIQRGRDHGKRFWLIGACVLHRWEEGYKAYPTLRGMSRTALAAVTWEHSFGGQMSHVVFFLI